MAGGAVSGSGSLPPRASVQVRIIGRFTGSRAARGRLSPAAARRAAAARICSSVRWPPRGTRGRPRPAVAMSSRWISFTPPPKVSTTLRLSWTSSQVIRAAVSGSASACRPTTSARSGPMTCSCSEEKTLVAEASATSTAGAAATCQLSSSLTRMTAEARASARRTSGWAEQVPCGGPRPHPVVQGGDPPGRAEHHPLVVELRGDQPPAVVLRADPHPGRDPHAGVVGRVDVVGAVVRDDRGPGEPRVGGVDDEDGDPAVPGRGGPAGQPDVIGLVGAGGEDLLPVDDVILPVP